MLNSTRPPYTATEYKPAPKAEVGGRNMDPEIDGEIDSECIILKVVLGDCGQK